MKIDIGNLRHRITFVKETTTTNARGFTETTQADVCRRWAAVNNLFGREYYAAMRENLENTVVFVIRYDKEVEGFMSDLQNYKIRFKDMLYEIHQIDNIQYKNHTLKIKASVLY